MKAHIEEQWAIDQGMNSSLAYDVIISEGCGTSRGVENKTCVKEEYKMSGIHGGFTSTGAILVLFILLVIISRSLFV